MRTTIKTLVLALVAFICFATEASAQKLSAAAVVDQHYATETAHYKVIMLGLAVVYAVYMMLYMKRKREVNRFMGKI